VVNFIPDFLPTNSNNAPDADLVSEALWREKREARHSAVSFALGFFEHSGFLPDHLLILNCLFESFIAVCNWRE
jgi:hypothetical protein